MGIPNPKLFSGGALQLRLHGNVKEASDEGEKKFGKFAEAGCHDDCAWRGGDAAVAERGSVSNGSASKR